MAKLRQINLGVFLRELEVYAEDAKNANRSVSLPPDTIAAVARKLREGYNALAELTKIVIQSAPADRAKWTAEFTAAIRANKERVEAFHLIEVV